MRGLTSAARSTRIMALQRIIDCTFVANAAVSGSGIYNDNGTLTAINDIFVGNTGVGTYYAAAGIYTNTGKSIITNCTFTANIGAAVAQKPVTGVAVQFDFMGGHNQAAG